MEKEEVILVDGSGKQIGTMEKMEAHRKGLLHLAFSVFVFNSKNELLLQRRALNKYHSPGLWTNTCCSHPRPGENTYSAALRRLKEEMGMEVPLEFKCNFTYRTDFDNGLTEHEFDEIYTGQSDTMPNINTDEVNEFKYLGLPKIKKQIKTHPENFTSWFKIAIEKFF